MLIGFDRRLAVAEQAVYTCCALLTRDTRCGSSLWGVNNRATNTARARRFVNAWGMQIRMHPDRIHQKE